ncbi:MAG TPA: Mrp/NBP35 family ATP-binding protein [Anaerolineae bacterium]|nr:Mrp/NBP35 family ATP-binding protein [Anaerolineae bacterium]
MAPLKDQIWQVLKEVTYPGYNRDIVSFGLVQKVDVEEGVVTVVLDVEALPADERNQIGREVLDALVPLPGVERVSLQAAQKVDVRPKLARREPEGPPRPQGVRRVVAVASGKGGVGKSTVAANLAVAAARQGRRTGLMDADAYGPNVPRMMGVEQLPPQDGGKVRPAEAHGVRVVSVGFLARPETPLIWRGPITDKMVRQFLQDVDWGELDLLVVDLPPSTGDIPISLGKHTTIDGAIIVVTPQQVALDDALKAIGMFRRMEVPVLGVIENMSYFVCDECGTRHEPFGRGGGRRLAEMAGVPFLGEVPLEPAVREGGDRGEPVVVQEGSLAGAAFEGLAGQLWQAVERGAAAEREPDHVSV